MLRSSTLTRPRKALNNLVVLLLLVKAMLIAHPTQANSIPQTLPFGQNWANTGLITTNDDWASVPGIVGFLGQDITTATGADPQTLLGVSAVANDVDVIANQTSTSIINGGVAEFEISNPTIALQGSGTADAPHIVIALNTTGQSNISVSYNLRDIDGSTDNAVQPVALQYRVGNSGSFTNIPAGFVADATTGPSLATLVTPVSATLPAAADNQGEVQVRIITTNAVGNDEWVGVDDLAISSGTPVESAPSIASTSPANTATGVAVSANISLTFSELVNVSGSWFSIACASSGAHTAAVSGGPASFTLNLDTDFENGESCTVTVVASQVSDQDSDDPPDVMAANYSFSFTTIASPNCGESATFIHTIQGSGTASALAGSIVTIEGVVVGDYQGSGQLGGYYVQEETADADADPATSEGIFVANTSFPVSAGDKVRATGAVAELPSGSTSLTQLSSVSSVSICSSGQNIAPAAVTLPIASLASWERYEGMLISIAQDLSVTENFTLGRFGEVSLSVGGRLDNPTNVVALGAPAIALQDLNNRSRILLDDGDNQQNRDPTIYPGGGLSASNTLRSGDTVNGLTGVLEQRFGVYRIQPVGPISFSASNPRSAAPEPISSTLKIASFNVLNYFNGDGLGGGFPTSRGATTAAEFARQRAKIISALLAIDADVVGLMEIENDATPNSAIEDLVGGLNAVAGAGAYAFIDTGVVGTDAIRVALIYQPASVTPIGDYAILDSSVDPQFIDSRNRPSLAQTFEQNANGEHITVAVNHLKSKGSACSGDPDTGDGQGNCNSTRTKAAEALVGWLATDPTGSGDADYLIIGDMNSYAKEDPITAITGAGYTDLIDQFIGSADAYSYVFEGQSGYLDHALASTALITQVAGVAEWHINADEPVALDYNVEFKSASQINTFYSAGPYRSSDHDPVIVGLHLGVASAPRKIYLPLVAVG
jgi:uncharacterized protein